MKIVFRSGDRSNLQNLIQIWVHIDIISTAHLQFPSQWELSINVAVSYNIFQTRIQMHLIKCLNILLKDDPCEIRIRRL